MLARNTIQGNLALQLGLGAHNRSNHSQLLSLTGTKGGERTHAYGYGSF